jgi:hypothetical protein
MNELYTDYFQKSKVFLYPLLKLKKGMAYVPIQTYVCSEYEYAIEDHKLLCEYHAKATEKFVTFYNRHLKSHKLFNKYIDLGKNKHLFIFDFIAYKNDFDRLIKGKYSQFSLESKLAILDFFMSSNGISDYIHDFLSPEFAHSKYAKALGVDIKKIKEIYEICSILDIEKETFKENNEKLNCLLTKNSIYLEK